MSYKHLSTEQRYEIAVLKRQGYSNRAIAGIIGVHPASIGRELRRNGCKGRYGAETADRRAGTRRTAASSQPRRLTVEMQRRIEEKLRTQQWSPEQIRDRLRQEGHECVSHEWIYLYIWQDKRNGGDLYTHLRQASKKRRKRYGAKSGRGCIRNRVSIDERPAIVDARARIGDWEIDTVIGAGHQGALVTIVERTSRYLLIGRVTSTTAEEVTAMTTKLLREHKMKVRTITADNGREFADHQKIATALGAEFYFAHPYHSWERGTNENSNGLIRQYFPKNTNFLTVTPTDVAAVQKKLNNRPRKVLGFKTPHEVFSDSDSLFFHKP